MNFTYDTKWGLNDVMVIGRRLEKYVRATGQKCIVFHSQPEGPWFNLECCRGQKLSITPALWQDIFLAYPLISDGSVGDVSS